MRAIVLLFAFSLLSSYDAEDPVSPVHGNVSVSRSSDSCNLTVTCSTKDSHHISSTFRCDNKTCSQDEGGDRSKVTTSGASLRVYLSNGSSVICNHSNQVSSAEDIIKIECDSFSDCVTKPPSPVVIAVIITVTVVVSVVVVIVAIAKVVQHRKKRKIAEQSMDMKNTVYESVQVVWLLYMTSDPSLIVVLLLAASPAT
ncbi:uncharacterized protein [Paralichthys olivaceus]|uniref:uncharacterized protein isoform X2 n=1 Tax=Paralichthys olivaceus TaxID=8255 RepID=UPI003751D67B